jgi:hypothetical protein
MWKVFYIHHTANSSYYVSRTFPTLEKAQEFKDVNAMVHPLPGVYIEDPNGNRI